MWKKSDFYCDSMPSDNWKKLKFDRLCGGVRDETKIIIIREGEYIFYVRILGR